VRPLVGITAAFERARWAVWDDIEVNISQRTYTDRIDEAGGLPVLLPTSAAGTEDPGELIGRIDGLLLSGGADLDPASYGAEPDPRTTNVRRARDEFELALTREALDRGVPVLGICRGFQVLNVALGGDLQQHVQDAEMHLHTPGRFSDHDVRLEPGSLAAEVAGAEHLSVRSHHHQGLARLGDGLAASGWSEPDGLIEAIEPADRDRGWALGILWHAEEETTTSVMRAFCAVTAKEGAGR
jgi:putative glutamine amidotransferase